MTQDKGGRPAPPCTFPSPLDLWRKPNRHGPLLAAVKRLLETLAQAAVDSVRGADSVNWGTKVGMGADGTPTSAIDKIAEDALLKKLREEGDPFNVLSEEHEYIDNGRQDTLVVDPIDGTYNAVHGIPNYSVVLAIGRKDLNGISHGLVREVTTGNTYYVEKGEGAWLNGRRLRAQEWRPGRDLFNLYLGRGAHPLALSLARRPRRVRNVGAASLDLAMVATGAADLYLMASEDPHIRLRISDIAASSLLVRESGGEVYDLDGTRLNMGLSVRERSNVLGIADRRLLDEVLK